MKSYTEQMNKETVRVVIIATVIMIVAMMCVSIVSADTYDYNTVQFTVNGSYFNEISLTSDSLVTPSSSIYFDFAIDADNHHLICKMQGGSWQDLGYFNGEISTVNVRQSSGNEVNYALITSGSNPYWHVSNITPVNLSNDVLVNITTVSTKLTTPVLYVNNQYISWYQITGAVSYTVQFSANGSDYEDVVTTTYLNYYPRVGGTYRVKANASNSAYDSDYSTPRIFTYNGGSSGGSGSGSDDEQGGILGWFKSRWDDIRSAASNAIDTIRNALEDVNTIFNTLFGFIPVDIRTMLWSIVVVMLFFGMLRMIL